MSLKVGRTSPTAPLTRHHSGPETAARNPTAAPGSVNFPSQTAAAVSCLTGGSLLRCEDRAIKRADSPIDQTWRFGSGRVSNGSGGGGETGARVAAGLGSGVEGGNAGERGRRRGLGKAQVVVISVWDRSCVTGGKDDDSGRPRWRRNITAVEREKGVQAAEDQDREKVKQRLDNVTTGER